MPTVNIDKLALFEALERDYSKKFHSISSLFLDAFTIFFYLKESTKIDTEKNRYAVTRLY